MEARVSLGERSLLYHWKQSARRRTVAISLHPQRGVVVHTPPRYPKSAVEDLLRRKTRWILRHLERIEREQATLAALRWEPGQELPFRGAAYPLAVEHGPEGVRLAEGSLRVSLNGERAATPLAERIRERVLAWYRAQAAAVFAERVAHFQQPLGVRPARIRVKAQQRRWGSCSARGALNFNWRLVLAPPAVLDYVVVHELCHLRVPAHSPRFWALVEGVLPDYRERRAWLRRHGWRLAI